MPNTNPGGRVQDLVCEYMGYVVATDWYKIYDDGSWEYTNTTYSLSYELTCSGGNGVGGYSGTVPTTGGASSEIQVAQSNCEGDPNCQALVPMIYDQNQDPIEDIEIPCNGNPLNTMAITNYNGGKHKNVFGCERNGSGCTISTKRWHEGIDLDAEINSPVHSISDGSVINTGYNDNGWGHWIIIRSGNFYYLYAHLNQASPLQSGEPITTNQIIAHSGASGNATNSSGVQPHLHLEVREKTGGKKQTFNDMTLRDPMDHISANFDSNNNYLGSTGCQ